MSATATKGDAGIANSRPEQSNTGDSSRVRGFVHDLNTPGQRLSDNVSSTNKDVPTNFTANDKLLSQLSDPPAGGTRSVSETERITTLSATTPEAAKLAAAEPRLTQVAFAQRSEAQAQSPEVGFKANGSPELVQNRQHLLDSYNAGQPDANLRKRFETSMKEFESRAAHDGVSDHEVAQTYKNIDQMLSAKNARVEGKQMNILAANVMDHAAHPENISQGDYGTCSATAIENRLFSKNPSVASEMVKEVASTGTYQTPDGYTIDLTRTGALMPRPESNTPYPADGERSFASQIMNNTIMNDMTLRREDPQAYYQLGKVDFHGKPLAAGDNGERLVNSDYSLATDPKNAGQKNTKLGAYPQEAADELHRLSGQPDAFLKYSPESKTQRIGNDPEPREVRQGNREMVPSHEQSVASQQELESKLAANQQKGNMPMLVHVDGYDPALNGGKANDKVGAHILVVRAYDAATKQVYVDNNWNKQRDGWIKTSDLFRAMKKVY